MPLFSDEQGVASSPDDLLDEEQLLSHSPDDLTGRDPSIFLMPEPKGKEKRSVRVKLDEQMVGVYAELLESKRFPWRDMSEALGAAAYWFADRVIGNDWKSRWATYLRSRELLIHSCQLTRKMSDSQQFVKEVAAGVKSAVDGGMDGWAQALVEQARRVIRETREADPEYASLLEAGLRGNADVAPLMVELHSDEGEDDA